MNHNTDTVQDRRTFIRNALRHIVLAAFFAIAAMLGFRRLTSDSAVRTSVLPCDRCTKYSDCSYGQTNYKKKGLMVARIDDCP